MDLTLSIILLIVLSGFIKGFTGFGMSIILISVLFELGFKPYEFLPIIVPIFVVLDIILYIENRKNITLDFKENFTLHPTTLMTLFLGVLLGTYLLTIIDPTYLKISFAVLVLIVLFFLIEKVDIYQMKIPTEKENGFFGFGAGILTGLLTMNAVPTTIYLMYHQYPKEKYMGNLVTFIIISDILLVAVYLFKELFLVEYLTTSLIFLLITSVGFFIGSYIRKFVPTKHFKSIVILILAINSLKIIFETLI